jgi:outer membrane protein OmpA-like peptidoglycan-associated protein
MRAKHIGEKIFDRGVSKEQIVLIGYGETKPIYHQNYIDSLTTDDAKEEAHQANRRLELKILEIK